ncbi:MAG: Arc family DNA-binding protein [Acidobacteria bacterium]|nr:Arc family DNA-binding protein [Acidobacteriota bacterium]
MVPFRYHASSGAAMPTLTIKNLPPATYERLKDSAQSNRRSLNSELIVCIERALGTRRATPEEVRQRAAELRAGWQGAALTMDAIDQAKRAGRP